MTGQDIVFLVGSLAFALLMGVLTYTLLTRLLDGEDRR